MQKANIIKLSSPALLVSSAAVGTRKEREGPLGQYFDATEDDVKFGMKTFEAGESEMQRIAFNLALAKAKMNSEAIGLLFAGDLLNQCTVSTKGLFEFDIPYLGLFGACSTMAQGLLLGALTVSAGYCGYAAAVTSSHFCAAERQFRFPLEYGGQRPPTAQWTVTGAGVFIIAGKWSERRPAVTEVLPGRIVDYGITDAGNMGAAMAPAVGILGQ